MKAFLNDTVLLLLFMATFAFAGLMIFAKFKFPSDGQLFQSLYGLTTAFSGAILLRINPQTKEEKDAKVPGAVTTHTENISTTLTSNPESTTK
jgi:hypothetical protein